MWTASRIVPQSGRDESKTPRLCVCPEVACCFAAACFRPNRAVYVYRTAKPAGSVRPVGVWDSHITGERWLVPPVSMRLVSLIPAGVVHSVQWSSVNYHRATGLGASVATRAALFVIAVETLGAGVRDRAVAAYLRGRFKLPKDPHNFIEERTLRAINELAKSKSLTGVQS